MPYLNQDLVIRFSPEVSMQAKLIEVTVTKNYSPLERKPFMLVFRTGQKDQYYLQGTYALEHPEKGDLDIFLVPIGPDAEGMKYEAIFS